MASAVPRLVWVLLVAASASASAQDLTIFTQVYNLSAAGADGKPPVVASSFSIFHAGKVYDWIEDANEVTIYEPSQDRFTVVSLARDKATQVAVAELKHLLRVAEHETEKYILELAEQPTPASKRAIQQLRFQLEPQFTVEYDESAHRLTLSSPYIRYQAFCNVDVDPETVRHYLRYADETARLNSVLHPHALFPTPRLILNERLREKSLMPYRVELEFDTELHLRAVHRIRWGLDGLDRQRIHHWKSKLKSVEMQPFRRFKEEMLAAETAQRR